MRDKGITISSSFLFVSGVKNLLDDEIWWMIKLSELLYLMGDKIIWITVQVAVKVNMHHKHDIGLKCSKYIQVHHETNYFWKFVFKSIPAINVSTLCSALWPPMIISLLSHAHLSAPSAQLPERACREIERAEHMKAKSWAQEAKELSKE